MACEAPICWSKYTTINVWTLRQNLMFQNNLFGFSEESGGPAWIVGSELGGLTLNIVARDPPARDINPELDEGKNNTCPVGIKGAYDRVRN